MLRFTLLILCMLAHLLPALMHLRKTVTNLIRLAVKDTDLRIMSGRVLGFSNPFRLM